MFSDPPAQFDKADIDTVLAHAQEQCALLASLEREMARNKEYLAKVSYTCPDLHTFLSVCVTLALVRHVNGQFKVPCCLCGCRVALLPEADRHLL